MYIVPAVLNKQYNLLLGNYSLSLPHTYPPPTRGWEMYKKAFGPLQEWNIKHSKFMCPLYGVHEQKKTSFFSFLNLDTVLSDSTPEYFRQHLTICIIHTPPPQADGTFALDPPPPRNFHSRGCLSYPLAPEISRIWDRNPQEKIVRLKCFKRYQSAFK